MRRPRAARRDVTSAGQRAGVGGGEVWHPVLGNPARLWESGNVGPGGRVTLDSDDRKGPVAGRWGDDTGNADEKRP